MPNATKNCIILNYKLIKVNLDVTIDLPTNICRKCFFLFYDFLKSKQIQLGAIERAILI